jgi:hypothetical protein
MRPPGPGPRPADGRQIDGRPHPPYFGGCIDLQNPDENGHFPGKGHVAVSGHVVEEGGKGLEGPVLTMEKASDAEGMLICFFETGFRGVGFPFLVSGALVLSPVFLMADRPGSRSRSWKPISRGSA